MRSPAGYAATLGATGIRARWRALGVWHRPCEGSAVLEATMTETAAAEVGFWSELDDQVLACLRDGPTSTRDLAHRLGLSPGGATSLLLMLAAEGKIRVTGVELAETV